MNQAYKLTLQVNKINKDDNKVILQNVIKDESIIERPYGEDGDEIPLKQSDGFRAVPLPDNTLYRTTFIYIMALYDETNTGLGITKNQPAPAIIEVNGQGITTGSLILKNNVSLNTLRVQADDSDDIRIRFKIVIAYELI
jgi:signal peptidase I